MSKNLWQKERNNIFRDLVKQYVGEGYDTKEAKRLSKRELDEIMEDREDFVNRLWNQSYDGDQDCHMWNLIVNHDGHSTLVDTFQTRKDAKNEIDNRLCLTQHLGYDSKEIYKIQKEYSNKRKNSS